VLCADSGVQVSRAHSGSGRKSHCYTFAYSEILADFKTAVSC
jgi:hypothetical protein